LATVINDVTIEPKAAPPGEPAAAKGASGNGAATPDMQREIWQHLRQARERAARLRAD